MIYHSFWLLFCSVWTLCLLRCRPTLCLTPPNHQDASQQKSQRRGPRPHHTVAIIGGGIAGLSCAQELTSALNEFDVTVFDTGRLRPGGRCSSRMAGDSPNEGTESYSILSQYSYDHAAQVIGKPAGEEFSEFRAQIDVWVEQGLLKAFPEDSLFRFGRNVQDLQPHASNPSYFYAPKGMGSIPVSMTVSKNYFKVEHDVWVSPSNGVKLTASGRWRLQSKGVRLGEFDTLVIAHNGKCADRLMSRTPAQDVHRLLRVRFAPTVSPQASQMTLNSIYSLTIAVPKPSTFSKALPPTFQCAFVDQSPTLSFVTCQTNKLPSSNNRYEVWSLLSTAKFGRKYKAAQEFLPDDVIENVSNFLVRALEELLKVPPNSIIPTERRLQLWGAALPLNRYQNNAGFVYDAQYNVGVCGDWLWEPSVAGAWMSGRALGRHVGSSKGIATSVGLAGSFERSQQAVQAGIGALS